MAEILDEIRALGAGRVAVILDDDATGSQAVRDVDVVLRPERAAIAAQLRRGTPGFFVLTNSRSLPPDAARRLALELGALIVDEARDAGLAVSLISRSDSTLRGHFPLEVDALAQGAGKAGARVLLAPYFGEGGRVTVDDVHYLERRGVRIPVAETEFAADPTFGYRASNLLDWLAEKAPGRPSRSVTIDALRASGGDAVADALVASPPSGVIVVNAVEQSDIELAVVGALRAEARGTPVVARTAASFARARLGQPVWPPLPTMPARGRGPGLVVVGSHVPTSTAQLRRLVEDPPTPLVALELDVDRLIDGDSRAETVAAAVAGAEAAIASGRTAVVVTSRVRRYGADLAADVRIARDVAQALVDVVSGISIAPAWVVAKGGITSSDIAPHALGARVATVLGQLLPGVSAWRLGHESRFPGLLYVVFPGNVGDEESLRRVVGQLGAA